MEGKEIAFAYRHTSAIVPPNLGIGGNAVWKGTLRQRHRQQDGRGSEGFQGNGFVWLEETTGDAASFTPRSVASGRTRGWRLNREKGPYDATRRSGQKTNRRVQTLLETAFAGQGWDQTACWVGWLSIQVEAMSSDATAKEPGNGRENDVTGPMHPVYRSPTNE
jgi:hypothetical protein